MTEQMDRETYRQLVHNCLNAAAQFPYDLDARALLIGQLMAGVDSLIEGENASKTRQSVKENVSHDMGGAIG